LVLVLAISLTASVAFFAGTLASEPELEAKTVGFPEPVVKEVPVYIEKVVPEPVIKEVPVYITRTEYIPGPVELQPFKSKDGLRKWLSDNYIRNALPGRCVDTALELCSRAWRDGYQMSTEVRGDGEPEGHMICSTVIGDEIYFLEPSTTAVWLAGVKATSVAGN